MQLSRIRLSEKIIRAVPVTWMATIERYSQWSDFSGADVCTIHSGAYTVSRGIDAITPRTRDWCRRSRVMVAMIIVSCTNCGYLLSSEERLLLLVLPARMVRSYLLADRLNIIDYVE
jgi:hypothetical protein